MASFQVAPRDLKGYASLLSRAANDARDCSAYFDRQVPELQPATDGIINPLVYEHQRVRSQLSAMLSQLVTLLDACHDGMNTAADDYQNSDRATAVRVDDSYPSMTRPTMRVN